MRNTGIRLIAIAWAALALAGCSHESADWKSAATADTTEAYQQFLQQHPDSSNSERARARVKALMEDHDWQAAASADTRSAYEQFVAQHADSKWAQEARIRIENFAQTGTATGTGGGAATASSAAPSAQTAPGDEVPPAVNTAGTKSVKSASATKVANSKVAAKPITKPAATKVATTSAHGNFVQLGAFHSKERAQSQWKHLAATYPTELKALKPDYVEGNSKHGTVYRLRVPVSSTAAAKGLCGSLKKHAQLCVPVTA